MEHYCIMCGSADGCAEYTLKDFHRFITKDFLCKKCAVELGLLKTEEVEKWNTKWWRQHLRMQIGRELTDEEYKAFYESIINVL